MRKHGELNYHVGVMGGGKSLHLLTSEYDLRAKAPTLIAKPGVDLKAGNSIETRLGNTRREVDFLIGADTDIEQAVTEHLARVRQGMGRVAASRMPYVFVDESHFLFPHHIEQMRELADEDFASFEMYALGHDFRGEFFSGNEALVKLADHIIQVESYCDMDECSRTAHHNARIVDGQVTRTGEQIAIDGIDATYRALCSKHYRESGS